MADRLGYTLVVGPPGADRNWIETSLLQGRLVVATASETDVVATRDLMPPKLIVLDDSGSREARAQSLKRVRAHPQLQGVPLLALSYDADIESYTEAIRVVSAYLVKPVDPEELVQVARRLSGWSAATADTEKRRRIRRPLIMKIQVRLRAQKRDVTGQMVDASGGGCRIELDERVAPGDLVRVVLHTRDASTHVALGAEVRWHRQPPSGAQVAGLRFTGTTALFAAKLLGFVSTHGT